MEITTNEKEPSPALAERETASGSRSLQSHLARASLFEQDEEPFQRWLRTVVPIPSQPPIDGRSSGSELSTAKGEAEGYWRADMPHRVVSRSAVEQTGDCTEPMIPSGARSIFGNCAPLPLVGDSRVGARAEERNPPGRLMESGDGWRADGCYDGAVASREGIATREDAVRILHLLEHHQSQWLTTSEYVPPLHLPRLPG